MNRHKRMAILIAPFLAIGGYIAADYYQQNQQADKVPQLIAVGDCRLLEKNCRLQAGDIKLNILMEQLEEPTLLLTVESSVPLDDVLITLSEEHDGVMPLHMKADQLATNWRVNLLLDKPVNIEKSILRLVVTYKGSNYFAELAVKY